MANTVNVTTIMDGERHVAVHVYIASDGASGELVNEVLVDPANFVMGNNDRFVIESITHSMHGCAGVLKFDELVDGIPVWVLPDGVSEDAEFCKVGGLKDRSGIDGTGKILLNTTGFTDLGDAGAILLKLRKAP